MGDKSGFQRVAVVGVGLMGGSLGLALKDFYPHKQVVGVDGPEQVKVALRRKAVDEAYNPEHLDRALGDVDLVVLATPIDEIIRLLDKVSDLVEGGTVVTDLGSTKSAICRAGWEKFQDSPGEFVGGHPMTGAEIRGMAGAHPLLYENSVFVLSPPGGNPNKVSRKLEEFLRGLGTEPHYLAPEVHDRMVARISHLPQLVAVGLMQTLAEGETEGDEDSAGDFLSYAGGGFKDMTRIADSSFDVWSDILSTNEKKISEEIELFLEVMEGLKELVGGGGMRENFKEASQLRGKIPGSRKGISSRTFKVGVMVPDKRGALAELTTVISDAGVNIEDIELQKVREDYGGTFHVYFETQREAREASKAMLENGFDSRVIE